MNPMAQVLRRMQVLNNPEIIRSFKLACMQPPTRGRKIGSKNKIPRGNAASEAASEAQS